MAYEWNSADGARGQGANASSVVASIAGAKRLFGSRAGGSWKTNMLSSALPKSAGSWVAEYGVSEYTTHTLMVGLGDESELTASGTRMGDGENVGVYLSTGSIWYDGNNTYVSGVVPVNGNVTQRVVTFYYNADNRKLWVADDGVIDSGGDPSTGTLPTMTVPGTTALEPMASIFQHNDGQIMLHGPDQIQYPADGFTPWGYVPATITIPSGDIKNERGEIQSAGAVLANIIDRATGLSIGTGTGTMTDGGITVSFDADVSNGDPVICVLFNASGTFKSKIIYADAEVV